MATAKVQVSAGTNEKLLFLDENMFMAGYGCLSGRFFSGRDAGSLLLKPIQV